MIRFFIEGSTYIKEIKAEKIKIKDLNSDFGNPRKISSRKKEELRESLETFGNFGLILIGCTTRRFQRVVHQN